MAILITIVVETDGRTTEVYQNESRALETARTIAKKIDNKTEGRKSYEEHGYICFFKFLNLLNFYVHYTF